MKKIILSLFLLLFSFNHPSLEGLRNETLFDANKKNGPKIVINNRILGRVNGKPISTYDLMKKMDVSFFRQYPEYASSIEARFQYYEMVWKSALAEMIDKQLILADAQESKIEVSSGDIRQEIETAFGPNVISNLDKAGLSYSDASKIMQDEIIIQRLIAGRVQAKAIRQVTPNKIRAAYEEYIRNPANARHTQWSYRIITVQERTLQRTEEAATMAYDLLISGLSPNQLTAALKERKMLGRKGKVTVSKILKQNDKEISKDYLSILSTLEKGSYSKPFPHKTRANNKTVYRMIVLEEKIPGGVPSYHDMESQLKEKLLDQEIDKETDNYLLKLHRHYHVSIEDIEKSLPIDYKPFELK